MGYWQAWQDTQSSGDCEGKCLAVKMAAEVADLSETMRLAIDQGWHGPLWDLAEDRHSVALIESFIAAGKPVALVCHAPGVLRHAKGANGRPLVEGKPVTGFTNSEEAAVELTDIVPFLVENELKARGGQYSHGPDWASYVVTDGLLITGQNPASSAEAAQPLLKRLT